MPDDKGASSQRRPSRQKGGMVEVALSLFMYVEPLLAVHHIDPLILASSVVLVLNADFCLCKQHLSQFLVLLLLL